jgi:hypothetical protein
MATARWPLAPNPTLQVVPAERGALELRVRPREGPQALRAYELELGSGAGAPRAWVLEGFTSDY